MKTLTKFFAIAISALTFAGAASAQEAPDALVKRISSEVLDTAKSDKDIQAGNNGRIMQLVEQKILPYVDFERMTQLAAGRFWRQATPEQQKQLITEFRSLLVYTYSGALAQVRDQKIEFKPLRASPSDTEVEVNSQVISSRGGEPIQLSYRLEKKADGWKLYDVNVLGAWLVEAYKGTFANEINKGGIDGLIKTLSDKNKQLAARAANGKK
jgi:phospholipid transport system substrate-binding protein